MKAIYHYRHQVGQGRDKVLQDAQLNVEILGYTDTQYKIKYLGFHANGAPVGHVTFVRKDRVAVDFRDVLRELPRVSTPKKVKKVAVARGWLPYKD